MGYQHQFDVHSRQAGIATIIHGISFGICVAISLVTVVLLMLRSKLPRRNRFALIVASDIAFTFVILFFTPNLVSLYKYFSRDWLAWEPSPISELVCHLVTWLGAALLVYMFTVSWSQYERVTWSAAAVYGGVVLASIISMIHHSRHPSEVTLWILFFFEGTMYLLIFIHFVLDKRAAARNHSTEGYNLERHVFYLVAGAVYYIPRIFWIAYMNNLDATAIWASPVVVGCAFLGSHILILHRATSNDTGAMFDIADEQSSGPVHL